MGRYVRDGHLAEAQVVEELIDAAAASGKPAKEVRRTVHDGVARGEADTAEAWYPRHRGSLPRTFVHQGREMSLADAGAVTALQEQARAAVPLLSCGMEPDATVRLTTFQGLTRKQGTSKRWTWPSAKMPPRQPNGPMPL